MVKRIVNQRGYSIIEIGIVFTAIATLSSGAIWGFSNHITSERYTGTTEEMTSVQNAVVNYGIKNRTRGTDVVHTSPNLTVTVHIPAGRPILPCPDMDGDGYEDRVDLEIGNVVTVNTTQVTDNGVTLAVSNLSEVPGRCIDDKGYLPYRTLRTKPADIWGNHYTYWVDANNFAHGVFGFDQTSKGSRSFKHAVVANYTANSFAVAPEIAFNPVYSYALQRAIKNADWMGDMTTDGLRNTFGNGIVLNMNHICTPYPKCQFTPAAGEGRFYISAADVSNDRTSESRKLNTINGITARVFDQDINSSILDLNAASVPVPYYDMVNGIAFAIVSHGKNGLGAATYETNPDTGRNAEFNCIRESLSDAELINARRSASCTYKNTTLNTCSAVTNANYSNNCQNTDRRLYGNGYFVIGTRSTFVSTFGSSVFQPFDDIVTWKHPSALIQELVEQKVLPQTVPPVAIIKL